MTTLSDTVANFKELASTCAHTPPPRELKSFIDGLDAIEVTQEFYGDYAAAANVIIDARLVVLRDAYNRNRAIWEQNLEELKKACELTDEEIKPESGPDFITALRALEQGKADGFREEAFGDLTEEAVAVQDAAIERFKYALAKVAVMVVDPDIISDKFDSVPVELLEYALENFKQLPLTLDAFQGHADLLAEAKRLHPLSVKKQEEKIAKAKERLENKVRDAIEDRDELQHRNRVADASLTPEQRAQREARMRDAATHLFGVVRRITEITRIEEERPDGTGVGMIDAGGLLELSHQASALVKRVEGSLH